MKVEYVFGIVLALGGGWVITLAGAAILLAQQQEVADARLAVVALACAG